MISRNIACDRLIVPSCQICFDPLVERLDAFNEPFLSFGLTFSGSSRIPSRSLIGTSGTDNAFKKGEGLNRQTKGETMDTILIVLIVLFLLGGGGWGYSRWRR